MYERFAIYVTPDPGRALAEFGACWLGWDSATGTARAPPQVDDLDVGQITEVPRKYGFHATIKPPFHLATGSTAATLEADLAALCATARPVSLEGLKLVRFGRFLALVPTGDTDALGELAASVVRGLDVHRAPLTDGDRKRRARNLTPAQAENLDRWGYPHVMDQFRFHMTLTGGLSDAVRSHAKVVLTERLAPLLEKPFQINALTLLGSDATGHFHQISRHPLTG